MEEANFLFLFFATSFMITTSLLVMHRGDILRPSVLLCGTMSFSAFMAAINIDRWSLRFDADSFLILTAALFSFTLGDFFCTFKGFENSARLYKTSKQPIFTRRNHPYNIKSWMMLIVVVIMAFFAYSSAHELYTLAAALGNENGYMGMIKTLRPAIESNTVTFSRWINYRQVFALSVAAVSSYALLYNFVYFKFDVSYFKWLFPIIMYVPFMILTTGRMSMMSFLIFFFVLGTLLYQKKNGYSDISTRKTIIFCIIVGIAGIAFFLLMGTLTGKGSSQNHSASMILAHYAGLSLPAFNTAIHSVTVNTEEIGSTTLLGIYRILARVGFDLQDVRIFLPFVHFDGIDTNVYTVEWRYFKDFGFFGMCAIMCILGMFYSFMYNIIRYGREKVFVEIFYSIIAFPLFLSSIDDRFFLDLMGTAIMYDAVTIWMGKKILLDYCMGSLLGTRKENHNG